MLDLVGLIRQTPFLLAPMAGITDSAFRSFMRKRGVPVVVTELISANGLLYSGEKTKKLMAFTEDQRPIGIQIFGETLDALAFAAQEVERSGADFVDLNFGCPVKKVVSKGAGSAILKDLVRLREVLETVKAAVRIPVTIKIRTGWDETTRNAEKVVQIAYECGITWVAIHGRTRSAGYSGQADWDYIKHVKANSPLPIIGNGDITTGEQAINRLNESGCDAVMIGRGCLKNPWIFNEAIRLWDAQKAHETLIRDVRPLLQELTLEYRTKFDDRSAHLQLKKFASWYSAGYPGASNFRQNLFTSQTFEQTLDRAFTFFEAASNFQQIDTSHEPFLMGGHG